MRALALVGVKLVILYALVMSVVQFTAFVPSLLSLEISTGKMLLGVALVVVSGPMLIMVLFMLAGPIARLLVPDQPVDSINLDTGALERALFAAVGLYFVLGGLLGLSWTVYSHWDFEASGQAVHGGARVRWGYFSHGVQIALGVGVLFGAAGLQGMIARVRGFGLDGQ